MKWNPRSTGGCDCRAVPSCSGVSRNHPFRGREHTGRPLRFGVLPPFPPTTALAVSPATQHRPLPCQPLVLDKVDSKNRELFSTGASPQSSPVLPRWCHHADADAQGRVARSSLCLPAQPVPHCPGRLRGAQPSVACPSSTFAWRWLGQGSCCPPHSLTAAQSLIKTPSLWLTSLPMRPQTCPCAVCWVHVSCILSRTPSPFLPSQTPTWSRPCPTSSVFS